MNNGVWGFMPQAVGVAVDFDDGCDWCQWNHDHTGALDTEVTAGPVKQAIGLSGHANVLLGTATQKRCQYG